MRLTVLLLGFELDVTLGRADNEPLSEFDEYQDAGTTGSMPIGFSPTPHPSWERPLNHWDEPGEDSEDT